MDLTTSALLSLEFTGQQLENRLSTVSAGLSLTTIVFVILTSQVGLYLWKKGIHSRDPCWIRGVVIFIWVMQALEFTSALACHMTAVAHSNGSAISMRLVKECLQDWIAYFATCATTECFVHAYFISRIYILETNQYHMISMMLCIILILEGVFGFISMLSFVVPSFEDSKHAILYWSFPVWLGMSILMDISIAGSMCYILNKNGPFISTRLSLWVKRLTRFCIQTGLITSLATGITVTLWVIAQLDPAHLLMGFPMGAIYATCFMANLIARESYFHHIQSDDSDRCFGIAKESIVFVTPEDITQSETISSGGTYKAQV